MLGRYAFQLQELCHLHALTAGRAIDDGTARHVWWQVRLENLVDVGKFLASRRRDHLERQVGTLGAAVENPQPDAEPVPEMPGDVLGHVRLRGCGQAQHRRHRPRACPLPDEAADVAVIGSESVAPSRQAVRLVQHPAADLALVERPAQGTGAELFWRDDENAGVAQPDPVQRVGPLGHR